TGVIVTQQLADQILNSARLIASSLAVPVKVSSLPALPSADWPVGSLVLRTTDRTLWKNVANSWVQVTASQELTGALTASDIQSINASQINGLITAAQIQSINAGQINGLIQASQIASINGSQIVVGSITSDRIQSIHGSKIEVGTITSDRIDSINGSKIAVGTITGDRLAIGTITGDRIAAGAITADKIGSINAGTITIGQLNANQIGSINASVIQSGPGNQTPGDFWVGGKLRVASGIDIAGSSNIAFEGSGGIYCGFVQATSLAALSNLTVGGQSLGNAAFRNVGSGSNTVASGTHTHNVTVTLGKSTETIWWQDQNNNWYPTDVVTDVWVQSVTVGQPQ
ncbi:MAG: hypothetical protein N2045_14090, partial [Fimbriimonadales bacterium]|nr:hypothetical protein [Fimbriimonadales bacterium]